MTILFVASPVFAISNPAIIAFGTGTTAQYKIFENVLETGDMMLIAESYVYYVLEPTDYTASEAYTFELLNTSGNVTYASTTLKAYGDRPISIYLSANQTTALGLVSGTAYGVRIMGNPLVFPSPDSNNITAYLSAGDYVDQLLGEDNGIATDNPMRNFLIQVADNIETEDAPPAGSEYITTVQGVRYLTVAGGDIFIAGIPDLASVCPILFASGVETIDSPPPEGSGAYASTLNPLSKWGSTVASGLTNLGSYLGISQALAGSVVLFVVVIALAVWIFSKTESGIATLLLVAATPFMGAYLGLMPMALAFILVIVIIVLLGYFFFSRGAL